jgi:hypothetical protein
MKRIFFDAGPIISLTMTNLLWLLDPLKSQFKGEFCITPSVKEELIDRPFETKRFKFEAIQVLQYLSKGTLKVISNEKIDEKARDLLSLANRCYRAKGSDISIVHLGEMETIAAALLLGADAVVIDERTTRYIIDKPERLARRMGDKLHTKVDVDKQALSELKRALGNLHLIRSTELVAIAFEHGLLDFYISGGEEKVIKDFRKNLLESAIWGLKINGCAISDSEIDDMVKFELKN